MRSRRPPRSTDARDRHAVLARIPARSARRATGRFTGRRLVRWARTARRARRDHLGFDQPGRIRHRGLAGHRKPSRQRAEPARPARRRPTRAAPWPRSSTTRRRASAASRSPRARPAAPPRPPHRQSRGRRREGDRRRHRLVRPAVLPGRDHHAGRRSRQGRGRRVLHLGRQLWHATAGKAPTAGGAAARTSTRARRPTRPDDRHDRRDELRPIDLQWAEPWGRATVRLRNRRVCHLRRHADVRVHRRHEQSRLRAAERVRGDLQQQRQCRHGRDRHPPRRGRRRAVPEVHPPRRYHRRSSSSRRTRARSPRTRRRRTARSRSPPRPTGRRRRPRRSARAGPSRTCST